MKKVCIVGAGPAGLVAAKTFLQTGCLEVTIYEKKNRLGGIWAIDEDTSDGFLHPSTPTNLSRFTVAFSDHDWNTVDVRSKNGQHPRKDKVEAAPPMFPKAWQVNRYLEEYHRKFVPEGCIKYRQDVVEATQIGPPSRQMHKPWQVTTKDAKGLLQTMQFDYLVLASGFFCQPRLHKQPASVDGLDAARITKVHSSQFKKLEDLFREPQVAAGKDILVIGGGNSGGETAAAVAMQLSDAQFSPDKERQKWYEGCKIVHVFPRLFYPLPPFHEYEEGSGSYVPVDLKLYDYSRRQPWPIQSYAGQQPREIRKTVHGYLQKLAGGNQSDLGSGALTADEKAAGRCAYVALTESYPEFVRSGMIKTVKGRVTDIRSSPLGTATVRIDHAGDTISLDNIGAVIYATGYTPAAALQFLDEDVKQALQYDPTSVRLPLILEQYQTMSPAVPELAFLGWYEGPYWPIMEMQARLTADRWLNNKTAIRKYYEEPISLLQLRGAMHQKALDVPQFWFSDYVGYMEDMANLLGLEKNAGAFGERGGCPSPARYLAPQGDRALSDATMHDLHETWKACTERGRYVPRAVFRALQGHWNIRRRIRSADPNFSGSLEGQASFHPRFPTKDKSGLLFDFEYLYVESGTFTSAANGLTMTASRRYVYRYSEARDELSVWFVKPDNNLEVDYLFHKLAFVPPAEARKAGACIAEADHLCLKDMYYTRYTLPLRAIVLPNFEVRHTVKGPGKDYVASTEYTRP